MTPAENSRSRYSANDVATSYDRVGDAYYQYFRTRPSEVVERYESLFIDRNPTGATVLELGCGNGLPMTAKLIDKFEVTAVDVSQKQIARARKNAPGARYLCADMSTLALPEAAFDGIGALYSITHVPREHHAELFHSIFHGSNPAASLWRHSTRRPKNHIWKKTGLERQCTGAAMVPTPTENWLHKSDLRLNRTVSRYRTILRLLEKKKYTSGSWPESPVRYHPPTHGRYKIRPQLPIDCQRPASNQIQKPKNR